MEMHCKCYNLLVKNLESVLLTYNMLATSITIFQGIELEPRLLIYFM